MSSIKYSRVCFVIMQFGTKKVGDQEVDFDFIYHQVFAPAVEATPLDASGRRLVLFLKDRGRWPTALVEFSTAVEIG